MAIFKRGTHVCICTKGDVVSRRENPDHKKLARARGRGRGARTGENLGAPLTAIRLCARARGTARRPWWPRARDASHVGRSGGRVACTRDEHLIARVRRQREEAGTSVGEAEGERCRGPLTGRATRRPTSSSSWVGAVSENRRSQYNSSK